jgi:methylglyoxal synthase
MEKYKKIALVAHDHKKDEMLEWIDYNKELLCQHDLYATGTTGQLIAERLGMDVNCMLSGPLGGDVQLSSMITNQELDMLIFFWDANTPMAHDVDVKALLRIAVLWNIPVACNRASADFMISSTLMEEDYERIVRDYSAERKSEVKKWKTK